MADAEELKDNIASEVYVEGSMKIEVRIQKVKKQFICICADVQ